MYTFENFAREIADIIPRYLPNDRYGNSSPKLRPATMAGDIFLIVPEETLGLTPCIALKEYYNRYIAGGRFNDIVIEIAKLREKLTSVISTENLFTLDNIHRHLVMRLVPAPASNPGIEIGDMKLTFCLLFEDNIRR